VVPLVFKTSLGAVRFPEGSTPSLLRQNFNPCPCGFEVDHDRNDCASEGSERHSLRAGFCENRLHDLPGLFLNPFQVLLTAHAFCVDFAEIFSSRWAHGKPAVL
jgi:hypothetical protein